MFTSELPGPRSLARKHPGRQGPRSGGARRAGAILSAVLAAISLGACRAEGGDAEVVVYTSVDQHYAEPVLEAFERETGIRVRPVYDVEAAKTTGLVNRLIAEQGRPQADVWWSGEFAQTAELAEKGTLATYDPPGVAGLPAAYRDPDGRWTGFGGRARVFLVNTDRMQESAWPRSIFDMTEGESPPGDIGMAYPMFGTTATQAAALYAALGPERARAYYARLRDRGVRLLDGNSVVRDQVADGRLAYGITDTDDACGAVRRGAPVRLVFPDQGDDQIGTLIIPNTVAMIAGAPHADQARRLIDYLLLPSTERDLVGSGWFQLALRPGAPRSDCGVGDVKGMAVSLREVAANIEPAKRELSAIFVR